MLLHFVVCLMLLVVAQFVLLLFIFHLGWSCLLHTLYSCCSFWVVIAHLVLLVLALGYYCLSCVVAPCLTLLLFVHVLISPSYELLLFAHLALLLFALYCYYYSFLILCCCCSPYIVIIIHSSFCVVVVRLVLLLLLVGVLIPPCHVQVGV